MIVWSSSVKRICNQGIKLRMKDMMAKGCQQW